MKHTVLTSPSHDWSARRTTYCSLTRVPQVISPWWPHRAGVSATVASTGAKVAVTASADHRRFTFETDRGVRYEVQAV